MNVAPPSLLTVEGLDKHYGTASVLQGVSFQLDPSEVMLLLGANGSGKSTLLRVCAGFVRPSRGRILVSGQAPGSVLGRIGFCSHQPMLYAELTVAENLKLHLGFAGRPAAELNQLLADWNLEPVAHKRLSDLSKGNLERTSLARAFTNRPSLLLLDEPTSPLDEASVAILKRHLSAAAVSAGVLIATHDIERLKDAATRVCILHEGRITTDARGATEIERSIVEYRKINR